MHLFLNTYGACNIAFLLFLSLLQLNHFSHVLYARTIQLPNYQIKINLLHVDKDIYVSFQYLKTISRILWFYDIITRHNHPLKAPLFTLNVVIKRTIAFYLTTFNLRLYTPFCGSVKIYFRCKTEF